MKLENNSNNTPTNESSEKIEVTLERTATQSSKQAPKEASKEAPKEAQKEAPKEAQKDASTKPAHAKNEKTDPLQSQRKKMIQLIIWLSIAIVVVVAVVVTCFFISKKNHAKNNNSSTQLVNVGLNNSSIWGSSSSSSDLSSVESEAPSSNPSSIINIVKPSTGHVTTAPEYKYDKTEDVVVKDNDKESNNKEDDTIITIPDKGNGGSSSSNVPSSSSSSSSSSAETTKTYSVVTDKDSVNIRTGAGTTFVAIGKMTKDLEYVFLGEEKDSAGVIWYQIQVNATTSGWATSQYAVKKEKQTESSSSSTSSSSSSSSSNPQYQFGWNTIDNNQYYFDGREFVKGWANIGGYRYLFDETSGAKRSSVGIDVSKYQGSINWSAVKASGVDFAFIRVGFRGYESGRINIDPTFETNIINANKAGVKCGVYFYSTAINEAEAQEEASFVLNAISGHRVDLPIVIDMEHRTDRVANLTNAQRTDITIAFLEAVKSTGRTGMLYTGHYYYNTYLESSRLKNYLLWIAYYTNNDKNVANVPYKYWQYTDSGNVDGIAGAVDLNVMVY